MTGPYTRPVEAARSELEIAEHDPFDQLRAEATAAIASTANLLRAIVGRYREASARRADHADDDPTLARLELAERTLEHTWLFLDSPDGVTDEPARAVANDHLVMRVIAAQEAERARLAREIHDGPAQALSNAIFQVDYIERITPSDQTGAADELRSLREMLRRELANVRDEINQLRPALPDDDGLETAVHEAAARLRVLADATVAVTFDAPGSLLDERQRTVVLRVAQEALHNVRKHAGAVAVVVRTERAPEDGSFILEIRDDGRGFDLGAVAARGRRNFGLQFMRERAELIGGRFDVRSQPGDGTVVRLAVPIPERTGAEETT
jgi:signal transduction histidine kinase